MRDFELNCQTFFIDKNNFHQLLIKLSFLKKNFIYNLLIVSLFLEFATRLGSYTVNFVSCELSPQYLFIYGEKFHNQKKLCINITIVGTKLIINVCRYRRTV